ncbi:hypothetical protein [Streptomyces sp. NBC_01314]|uniref:hypothetical protein n=1 Tax=Streptomyces sp. NBC_01314 TaxID=2903821 RepID=UPI00309388AF|nr:hypothetical protein OG622_02665 [Streptomyces sp. NBC_01314]
MGRVQAEHRGDLVIGPASENPDVVVESDEAVDWSVFEGMTTPSGGLWPRWIHYVGNDTSVFAWAVERPIEALRFQPETPGLVIDASASRINTLNITHGELPVTVKPPPGTGSNEVIFAGDPSVLTVVPAPGPLPRVALRLPSQPTPGRVPAPADGSAGARALPPLTGLADAESLEIAAGPLDVPLDLRSLTQLHSLRKLRLQGGVAHPEALADLPLHTLELRMVPDLTGLPPLTAWPELASFLGWNIDATVGKRLRADLKKRGLATRWETTAHGGRTTSAVWQVSHLRTAPWFVTQSGLPFTVWPRRTAKQAVTAFKTAAKILDRTDTAGTDGHTAAQQAIEEFTRALNQIDGIYTAEREDAATAVLQLARLATPPIPEHDALAWFDRSREF